MRNEQEGIRMFEYNRICREAKKLGIDVAALTNGEGGIEKIKKKYWEILKEKNKEEKAAFQITLSTFTKIITQAIAEAIDPSLENEEEVQRLDSDILNNLFQNIRRGVLEIAGSPKMKEKILMETLSLQEFSDLANKLKALNIDYEEILEESNCQAIFQRRNQIFKKKKAGVEVSEEVLQEFFNDRVAGETALRKEFDKSRAGIELK